MLRNLALLGIILLVGCSNDVSMPPDNKAEPIADTAPTVDISTNITILAKISPSIQQLTSSKNSSIRASLVVMQNTAVDMTMSGDHASFTIDSINNGTISIIAEIISQAPGTEPIILAVANKNIVIINNSQQFTIEFSDYLYLDSDNDGFSNLVEVNLNTDPLNSENYPNTVNPIVIDSTLKIGYVANDSIDISWTLADKSRTDSVLQYSLYYSKLYNITTASDALLNGIRYGVPTSINTMRVADFVNYKDYNWNVIVSDQFGNISSYSTRKAQSILNNNFAGGIAKFGTNGNNNGNSVATDSMGNIIVVGTYRSGPNFSDNDLIVLRYKPDGVLDETFNGVGYVIDNSANAGAYAATSDQGSDVAVDSQDRIIVTGITRNIRDQGVMAVWRFEKNGSLDPTFNEIGYYVDNPPNVVNGSSSGSTVVLDGSGNIYVAGSGYHQAEGLFDMMIWKLTDTGKLDTTFNGNGTNTPTLGNVTTNGTNTPGDAAYANDMTIDTSGHLVITGRSKKLIYPDAPTMVGVWRMSMWRYDLQGNLDLAFNTTGYFALNSNNDVLDSSAGHSVITQSDGTVIVTGQVNNDMMVWKFDSNGLDPTFNSSGTFPYTPSIADSGNTIMLDRNNMILVAGNSSNALTIWRIEQSGKLDSTFGNGLGFIQYNTEGSSAKGMTISNAGLLILTGVTSKPVGSRVEENIATWMYFD